MDELGNIEGTVELTPTDNGYLFEVSASGTLDSEIPTEDLAKTLLEAVKNTLAKKDEDTLR